MIAIVGAHNAPITAQRHAQKMAAELGQHGLLSYMAWPVVLTLLPIAVLYRLAPLAL